MKGVGGMRYKLLNRDAVPEKAKSSLLAGAQDQG